ncbi:head-to-tail stopper [Mycobacterium phage Achebe]|uniref:Head-to-tail stopper n=1 Tax=Mycobacterium phage Backyardigan TaxID=2902881 RepID=G1BKZ2_9CAUD|nr:head closure Hc1 [Mycobacterium phage Wile]YP_009635432.1 head closure Hc1 [Mycobacterium phage Backyardigan]AOT27528.1 head-to-tail stopper [Mycobacterium phage Badger]APD17369.1 head-to-tail stopper [Mycobacterium phage Achebe]QAY06928.1 head-to-tail stopper [Mycobacterium phage Datway]QCW22669.1 head-to-tail stopper [Mycobacterium phage Xena]AEJ94506.1 head-to-tail stopper [Mycobacterium phage Backyardigan]
MSLLDHAPDDVIVYPQIVTVDDDGNTITKPSETGIPTKARLQVLGQSGTSSRRQEQDNEGFESERVYTIRFTRKFDKEFGILGMQSEVEWMGVRWSLFGEPAYYTNSRRTRHITYTVKRF